MPEPGNGAGDSDATGSECGGGPATGGGGGGGQSESLRCVAFPLEGARFRSPARRGAVSNPRLEGARFRIPGPKGRVSLPDSKGRGFDLHRVRPLRPGRQISFAAAAAAAAAAPAGPGRRRYECGPGYWPGV